MVLKDLINNETTKKFEMGTVVMYVYQKPREEFFKIQLGSDFLVCVMDGENNITRDICKELRECYSSNGYMIINTINIRHNLDRIVRCLFEKGYRF